MRAAITTAAMLLAALAGVSSPVASASAAGSTCSVGGDLMSVTNYCTYTAVQVKRMVRSGDGHTYTVRPLCAHAKQNPSCVADRACDLGDGRSGIWHGVHRDREGIGRVCLSQGDAQALGQVTPGMVLRAFKRLSWPKAELVIQPPKGKTLVNFETLFYTDTPPPKRQVVRLLGQRIVIEATPQSYRWFSTQGGESWSTTDPSRRKEPADEATDMNFFIYEKTGDYAPSVDVTYAGRFRVGGGPWRDIPGTLTVSGASQPLKVVEAVPVLVDPHGG